MRFVQPIWDRLSIPSERQLQKIADSFFFFLLFTSCTITGVDCKGGRGFRLLEKFLFAFTGCE
jgi:hypothetical protein